MPGFSFQLAAQAVLWKTDHGRGKGSNRRVHKEAIFVVWVRNVGYRGEFGTDGGGDMWSNKGHILKSELKEIANGSEVDVRQTTKMTNSSSNTS